MLTFTEPVTTLVNLICYGIICTLHLYQASSISVKACFDVKDVS